MRPHTPPVVANQSGGHYQPNSLENLRVEWNLRGHNLPPFHIGRHTLGTLLVLAGTDIYRVSRLLRHRSVRTTEQIYAYLKPVDCREGLERLRIE